MSIQISPQHKIIVMEILKKHDIEVFVFGSRAKHTARPLSDLDLCVRRDYAKSTLRDLKRTLKTAISHSRWT